MHFRAPLASLFLIQIAVITFSGVQIMQVLVVPFSAPSCHMVVTVTVLSPCSKHCQELGQELDVGNGDCANSKLISRLVFSITESSVKAEVPLESAAFLGTSGYIFFGRHHSILCSGKRQERRNLCD
jgi:hypothetical protein